MTTDQHMNRSRKGATAKDRDERARRTVKAFRSMQHGLTGYARALTRNPKARVELATGAPRTDGTTIWYQPPLALGDPTPHQRMICDKRNKETKRLLCPACAIREEVLVNIVHEIGHIAFGTFTPTTDMDKRNAVTAAINEWGSKYADRIKRRIDMAQPYEVNSYGGLANLISPYLPFLVNCLEDVRVDSQMIVARPGVRVMLEASMTQIFSEGNEGADGTLHTWMDNPLNAQASIATYIMGCGFQGLDQYLHPELAKVFGDEELKSLLKDVSTSKSASDTYHIAFPVLARLRELGFFQMPEDKEEEKDDQSGQGDEEPEEVAGDESDASDDADEPDDMDGSEGEPGEGVPSDDDAADEGASSPEDQQPSDDRAEGDDGPGSGDDAGDGEPSEERDPGESGPGDASEPAGPAEGDEAGEASPGDEAGTPGEGELDASGTESGAGTGLDGGEADDADEGTGGGGANEPSQEDGDDGSSADSGLGGEQRLGSESDGQDRDADDGDEPAGREQGASTDPDSTEAGSEPDSAQGGPDDQPVREGDSRGGEDAGLEDGGHDGEEADPEPSLDPADASPSLEGERYDTGADEGKGGTQVPLPEYGEPEDVAGIMEQFHPDEVTVSDDAADEKALEIAIVQGLYFEKPSEKIVGVREHVFNKPTTNDAGKRLDQAWANERYAGRYAAGRSDLRKALGIEIDLDVPESIMGPALLQTRRVFTDNAVAAHQHNLRSGRINKRVLGRRAWGTDDRLFTKKRLPGKKSYAVLIGIDVSGSTLGENIALAKRAAWAQAELCQRAGIKFAVYAHSASRTDGSTGRGRDLHLDIYEIKKFDQPWNPEVQEALKTLGSDSENLDGHTLEYYRKRLDEVVDATDKILLYYTDGKMPAANHDEELEILQREIQTCKQKQYTLLGVGIRTDSPKRHGLDTVQVNDDADLKQVVMHLEKQLLRRAA